MMWQIINDRKMFRLSAKEMMLFARLPGLTPGLYKQVLAIAEWHTPKVSTQLTKLGEMPEALYYVLKGKVKVIRDGKRFSVGPHALMKSNDGVRKAFDNMLSIDMAEKIAKIAAPILQEQSV